MTDDEYALAVSLLEEWCLLAEPLEGREPSQVELADIRQFHRRLDKAFPNIGKPNHIVRWLRLSVLRHRDGDLCHYCREPLEFGWHHRTLTPMQPIPRRKRGEARYRATIDHWVPQKNGGKSRLDNLVLACQPCNSARNGHPYPTLDEFQPVSIGGTLTCMYHAQ